MQQPEIFTKDSKSLFAFPQLFGQKLTNVDNIEIIGNMINTVFNDFTNTLQGVQSTISRDKDLDSIMRERIAFETKSYQQNLENFTNKVNILESALDNIKNDKGTFKINGAENWAFYSNPSANYAFDKKRIEDGDGFITMIKTKKENGTKPFHCKSEGIFGRLKGCTKIDYGKSNYGRLSKIRQLNVMMDELYSAIYSLELEKTTIGKHIHTIQPEKGSFIENVVQSTGDVIGKLSKSISSLNFL